MKKRGHGEGSIYQRTDGRWCACLTMSKGRRKYFYGQSRREVWSKLIMAQAEQDQASSRNAAVPSQQQAS
jgi:integrase